MSSEAHRLVLSSGAAHTDAAAIGLGQTLIQSQVVAKIASLAVQEVEGVHRLVPYGAGQSMASLARSVTGGALREIGVQVEVDDQEVTVATRIVTVYGAPIPVVAEGIRRNVAARVAEMTGLRVASVDVDVVDLYFEGDEAAEEPPTWSLAPPNE